MSITGDHRQISINTSLGPNELVLARISGREELSRLFEYRVDLVSEKATIDPDKLLGTNATVQISDSQRKNTRYVNAVFTSFTEAGAIHTPAYKSGIGYAYRAVLSPYLWFLTRRATCRAFADTTVPDIVKKIVSGYGIQIETRLGTSKPWKLCFQYRETDFNFISRLMEQEGIDDMHEHSNGAHKLVLMDGTAAHAAGKIISTVSYENTVTTPGKGPHFADELVATTTVQSGKFAHTDYDFFKMISVEGVSASPGKHMFGDLEIYDYPAESVDVVGAEAGREVTDDYAKARLQELRAQVRVVRGSGSMHGLETGTKIKIDGAGSMDGGYLITATTIDGSVTEFDSGSGKGSGEVRMSFAAIPEKTVFRPQRITPKPVIQGAQTAIVVSEPDKHARVQVRFHWLREGNSPWVRVSQSMAGKQWGAMFIPRVNHEVVVDFLDGDPDRPLITGVVYNGVNKPPYPLPGEKTKSTIKTNSFDGGGSNEIRLEDKNGSEHIFIHAQKDYELKVLDSTRTHIAKESHLTVVEKRYDEIGKDDSLKVKGDHKVEAVGNWSYKTGQKIQLKSGSASALDAGTEIHLKAGMNIILEAGMGITLKAGSNSIVLGPAGISIDGVPFVKVNSGGSPGSGSGSSPTAPEPPKEPDKGKAGEKEAAPVSKQPPPAATYSPQAVALKQAAQSGAPFCEN